MNPLRRLSALLPLVFAALAARAELRIPANTGYILPDPYGAKVDKEGIRRWKGPAQQVLWAGELKQAGEVTVALVARPPAGATSRLRLTVNGKAAERELRGTEPATLDFGTFPVPAPGYTRFTLESLNAEGADNGEPQELVLGGPAAADAHFNLKPRRNAASIHLGYPVPAKEPVEWFFATATGVEDPLHTFYMACGFSRGYFGMQVNHPNERRIIFSVWDSGEGGSADRRDQVKPENHVQLVAKGEDVHASVFGGEGTGGHSHLKYLWKTGEPQHFAVRAQPEGTFTTYSGYWFHPEKKAWMLIASFKAPKDGKALRGLHSFVENFGGETGYRLRKARYGDLWARTAAGEWHALTEARFTHDATGHQDRLDRFGGVENGQFFLSNGGFVPGMSNSGDRFLLPAAARTPPPALPAP